MEGNDGVDRKLFLVVGYWSYQVMSTKELKMYGIYNTVEEANVRIQNLTKQTPSSIGTTTGNNYTCWINRLEYGDFKKLPSEGAFC